MKGHEKRLLTQKMQDFILQNDNPGDMSFPDKHSMCMTFVTAW